MVVSTAIQRLGPTPSLEDVDKYLVHDLGLRRKVVGKSLQGRDLVVYETASSTTTAQVSQKDVPTVLFLSLVHGNEVMGLISLLATAQTLVQGTLRLRSREETPVRLVFFPLVNVDGYLRNQACAAGQHRGNLRDTGCTMVHPLSSCLDESANGGDPPVVGVDLNRNFPADWNGTFAEPGVDDRCVSNFHGTAPFSEPETRAIRQIVEVDYFPTVKAALSFHSLSGKARGKALLIHPYASKRPLTHMPAADLEHFRAWSQSLNPTGLYKTGTARETIDYTAGGTTMDWLYEQHNVTAFVLETVPSCQTRWCPATPPLYRSAYEYGMVGRRLVELVVHGKVVQDTDSIRRSVLFMLLVTALWLAYKWKHPLSTYLRRRFYGKLKNVSVSETEMQSLR
jgi:hypothetical protein